MIKYRQQVEIWFLHQKIILKQYQITQLLGKILVSCAAEYHWGANRCKHIRRIKNPVNYQDSLNNTDYKDSIGSLEKIP